MIKKYEDTDFKLLTDWVTDDDLLFQFSGPDWTFPITKEQIRNHQLKFPFRQLYVGYNANCEAYALGEIITNEQDAPRLGRLLIGNPSLRGKGLGQVFIGELIEECSKLHSPEQIHLFVYEHNLQAIKCYERLGFRFNNDGGRILVKDEKEVKVLKMTLEVR